MAMEDDAPMLRQFSPGCVLLAVALLSAVLPAPTEAVGASGGSIHIAADHAGLRLELTLSHNTYPRDALVRAWAHVRNTSNHMLWIDASGPAAPGKYSPQVEVFDSAGRQLPISLTAWGPFFGPGPVVIPIAPGQSVGGPEDVVLQGSHVRLSVKMLFKGRATAQQPGTTFTTPTIHVHLLPADPPTVRMGTDNGSPSATVIPPTYAHGQPWAVWSADCGGYTWDERIDWGQIDSRLTPNCSPVHAWHALVGWHGHSVAVIDYRAGLTATRRAGLP